MEIDRNGPMGRKRQMHSGKRLLVACITIVVLWSAAAFFWAKNAKGDERLREALKARLNDSVLATGFELNQLELSETDRRSGMQSANFKVTATMMRGVMRSAFFDFSSSVSQTLADKSPIRIDELPREGGYVTDADARAFNAMPAAERASVTGNLDNLQLPDRGQILAIQADLQKYWDHPAGNGLKMYLEAKGGMGHERAWKAYTAGYWGPSGEHLQAIESFREDYHRISSTFGYFAKPAPIEAYGSLKVKWLIDHWEIVAINWDDKLFRTAVKEIKGLIDIASPQARNEAMALKSKWETLEKQMKAWETAFLREHGRRPSIGGK